MKNNLTALPPDMLDIAMMMVKRSEQCPDVLTKAICLKNRDNPRFVQWMFRAFGGTTASDLATNAINFYRKHF